MTADDDGRRRRFEHRRGEVLQAATDHVIEHGLADLSLRRLGEHVGVSHAALLHHFGSKERLVAEVVESIVGAALASPDIADDDPDPLRTLWRLATAPRGMRLAATFLEIAASAARGADDLRTAVSASIAARERILRDGLVRSGCPESRAAALATFTLASMRGLVADLIVTGDRDRVDRGFEVLHALVTERAGGR
ncbi:TetR/AcrR family transcriptional regulator [Microbacterium karelineae]|uniref:TetR/AcrR family transcriptional regulator n=1 Tax=Microbacterium karelineae TaxID=2654283 RepID=UPI0012EA38E3|nr:TetR/AcrR family transcriptional regulator [Microbacterium karelineae]